MSSKDKVKIINSHPYKVGIKSMDGLKEFTVHEAKNGKDAYILIDRDEIYYTNNISRLFSSRHLIIDDDEINQDLGLSEKTVANLSAKDILDLLNGNLNTIKKELSDITQKHTIDRVIEVAKNIDDLPKNKITFLQDWSGYDFDQLIEDDKADLIETDNKKK